MDLIEVRSLYAMCPAAFTLLLYMFLISKLQSQMSLPACVRRCPPQQSKKRHPLHTGLGTQGHAASGVVSLGHEPHRFNNNEQANKHTSVQN